MDRDEAGAINILAKALRELSRGGQSQTSSLELVNANGHINLYQLSESLADKLGGAKLESRCYTLIGLTVGECQSLY